MNAEQLDDIRSEIRRLANRDTRLRVIRPFWLAAAFFLAPFSLGAACFLAGTYFLMVGLLEVYRVDPPLDRDGRPVLGRAS